MNPTTTKLVKSKDSTSRFVLLAFRDTLTCEVYNLKDLDGPRRKVAGALVKIESDKETRRGKLVSISEQKMYLLKEKETLNVAKFFGLTVQQKEQDMVTKNNAKKKIYLKRKSTTVNKESEIQDKTESSTKRRRKESMSGSCQVSFYRRRTLRKRMDRYCAHCKISLRRRSENRTSKDMPVRNKHLEPPGKSPLPVCISQIASISCSEPITTNSFLPSTFIPASSEAYSIKTTNFPSSSLNGAISSNVSVKATSCHLSSRVECTSSTSGIQQTSNQDVNDRMNLHVITENKSQELGANREHISANLSPHINRVKRRLQFNSNPSPISSSSVLRPLSETEKATEGLIHAHDDSPSPQFQLVSNHYNPDKILDILEVLNPHNNPNYNNDNNETFSQLRYPSPNPDTTITYADEGSVENMLIQLSPVIHSTPKSITRQPHQPMIPNYNSMNTTQNIDNSSYISNSSQHDIPTPIYPQYSAIEPSASQMSSIKYFHPDQTFISSNPFHPQGYSSNQYPSYSNIPYYPQYYQSTNPQYYHNPYYFSNKTTGASSVLKQEYCDTITSNTSLGHIGNDYSTTTEPLPYIQIQDCYGHDPNVLTEEPTCSTSFASDNSSIQFTPEFGTHHPSNNNVNWTSSIKSSETTTLAKHIPDLLYWKSKPIPPVKQRTRTHLVISDSNFLRLKVHQFMERTVRAEKIKFLIDQLPVETNDPDDSCNPYLIETSIIQDAFTKSKNSPEIFAKLLLSQIFNIKELQGHCVYGCNNQDGLDNNKVIAIECSVRNAFPSDTFLWKSCVKSMNGYIKQVFYKIKRVRWLNFPNLRY